MKAVRVAELKSHLSQHLRSVRSGEAITVLDRQTPVARLVPVELGDEVTITLPAEDSPPPGRVRLPAAVKTKVDVVRLLVEDRRRRG